MDFIGYQNFFHPCDCAGSKGKYRLAQQIIPQSRIHDIILAEDFQGFLPLNVKPLDFIGDIGILQRFEISLNGMGCGFDFSIAFRQQSLADQGISNSCLLYTSGLCTAGTTAAGQQADQ